MSCLDLCIGDELSGFMYRGRVVWGPVVGDELSGGQLSWDELTWCQKLKSGFYKLPDP